MEIQFVKCDCSSVSFLQMHSGVLLFKRDLACTMLLFKCFFSTKVFWSFTFQMDIQLVKSDCSRISFFPMYSGVYLLKEYLACKMLLFKCFFSTKVLWNFNFQMVIQLVKNDCSRVSFFAMYSGVYFLKEYLACKIRLFKYLFFYNGIM